MLVTYIILIVLGALALLAALAIQFMERAQNMVSGRISVENALNILYSAAFMLLVIGIGWALLDQVLNARFTQGVELDSRESFTVFGVLQIRYYGIIIVAAMLVAANVAARLAQLDGRDPEHVWGMLTWAIIPGIILARLWFITFPPSTNLYDAAYYYSNFFDVADGGIAIWSGGLSIFGAVIGGLGGSYIYMSRNGLAIPAWLDIAGVALPLGQAIGRWANYINQELYGAHTNLPWGILIEDSAKRVFPYASTIDWPTATTKFHPLFLYESLWSLVAFMILLNLFLRNREKFVPGDLFLIYLMQYSVIRFLLEFLRLEVSEVGGLNLSQIVTAVVFVIAAVLFYMRRNNKNIQKRSDMQDPDTLTNEAAA